MPKYELRYKKKSSGNQGYSATKIAKTRNANRREGGFAGKYREKIELFVFVLFCAVVQPIAHTHTHRRGMLCRENTNTPWHRPMPGAVIYYKMRSQVLNISLFL